MHPTGSGQLKSFHQPLQCCGWGLARDLEDSLSSPATKQNFLGINLPDEGQNKCAAALTVCEKGPKSVGVYHVTSLEANL